MDDHKFPARISSETPVARGLEPFPRLADRRAPRAHHVKSSVAPGPPGGGGRGGVAPRGYLHGTRAAPQHHVPGTGGIPRVRRTHSRASQSPYPRCVSARRLRWFTQTPFAILPRFRRGTAELPDGEPLRGAWTWRRVRRTYKKGKKKGQWPNRRVPDGNPVMSPPFLGSEGVTFQYGEGASRRPRSELVGPLGTALGVRGQQGRLPWVGCKSLLLRAGAPLPC